MTATGSQMLVAQLTDATTAGVYAVQHGPLGSSLMLGQIGPANPNQGGAPQGDGSPANGPSAESSEGVAVPAVDSNDAAPVVGTPAAPANPNQQPISPCTDPFLLITFALMFVLMYFLIIRPRNKEEAQRKAMLDELKKGDRVVTVGGIIGKVVEMREDEIVLKVDENTGARLHFSRAAISRKFEAEAEKK